MNFITESATAIGTCRQKNVRKKKQREGVKVEIYIFGDFEAKAKNPTQSFLGPQKKILVGLRNYS